MAKITNALSTVCICLFGLSGSGLGLTLGVWFIIGQQNVFGRIMHMMFSVRVLYKSVLSVFFLFFRVRLEAAPSWDSLFCVQVPFLFVWSCLGVDSSFLDQLVLDIGEGDHSRLR